MSDYDVVIIGAGPAGLTAGLYAARAGLKTCIVAKELGGTANSIVKIDNWPGFSGKGVDLMRMFYEPLKNYKIEVAVGDVTGIEKKKDIITVKSSAKEFSTKTLIIATGIKRGNVKISGEEKFKGKGVSYCATCDAFFYKGKTVGIIVNENANIEEINTLSNLAAKVYVICKDSRIGCEKQLKKLGEKASVILGVLPQEIYGDGKVEGIWVKDSKGEREIKLDGVFIEAEETPMIEFAKSLKMKLDEANQIAVDEFMSTSTRGVFAAGDVTNYKLKQVLIASAHGAVAAKSAEGFLRK